MLLRLAVRNVRRSARRSILTSSAMVLGLALLIISRTLADGAHESWIDQGVRLAVGHVAVQGSGFRQSRSLSDAMDGDAARSALEALADPTVAEHVEAIATRVSVDGLASSAGSSSRILLVGVDPAREPTFTFLDENLEEGRYLEPDDRLAAVIGSGLAERLGIRIGSRFVVTAADASGEIQGQLLRVRGIFRTGVPELDQSLVHMPQGTAQSWLGMSGGLTDVAVLLHESGRTGSVARELRARLAGGGVDVLTWREASPELDAAVKIDDFGDWVFHAITFVIIALAILNAVLMSVMHRTREFGVLRALGLTGSETGRVVLAEGLLLSLVSGLLGVLIGFAVVWFFWRDGLDLSFLMEGELTFGGTLFEPIVIPAFRPAQVLWSLCFIVVIGVGASLHPARQAARIDVAEAMKFER